MFENEIQIRYKGVCLFNKQVPNRETAQILVEQFLCNSGYCGDLEFCFVENDENCDELSCEVL